MYDPDGERLLSVLLLGLPMFEIDRRQVLASGLEAGPGGKR
jgi:hypothetical protein